MKRFGTLFVAMSMAAQLVLSNYSNNFESPDDSFIHKSNHPLQSPSEIQSRVHSSLDTAYTMSEVTFVSEYNNKYMNRKLEVTSPPSFHPSALNIKKISFSYALELNFRKYSPTAVQVLIGNLENDIGDFLDSIGYFSISISSTSKSQNNQGSCKVENRDIYCTVVEVIIDVSSVSRFVVAEEVLVYIKTHIDRINIFVATNGIEAKVSNAIETEFTYFYSTTDFNAPFFSFDSKIAQAYENEGYEVLSYVSMLDQFLGPGFWPKGATCHPDYAECTLNTGAISVIQQYPEKLKNEELGLLRIAKTFMDNLNNKDISMLTYRSPELLEIGEPSIQPSESPIVTPSPSIRPSLAPSILFRKDVVFVYALEYSFSGSAPDILPILLTGVEAQVSHFLGNIGYNSNFISSTPESDSFPGSCKKDNPNVFCTLVEAVVEVSSRTKPIDENEVIYGIKPEMENMRFTDRNVGLDGRLIFVTNIEFTYIYSTTSMDFPFFSFDPVVLKGITDQGFAIVAFSSELIQFLGGSFWPKGSRCHPDYVECTLNKGVLTVPLPDEGMDDEMEESILRATKYFMMTRTDDEVSMLTYRTPEFSDPTTAPSGAPSNFPFATNSPTNEPFISITFEYALESSSPRILQSLSVYLEPMIKYINTEILVHMSKFVSVRGMTSNLFKECKATDVTIFCSMISSVIDVKLDPQSSAEITRSRAKEVWDDFLEYRIIESNRLGVSARIYQFFFFEFTYLVVRETSISVSYDEIDLELDTVIRSNSDLEILSIDFEELDVLVESPRHLQEEFCENNVSFCAFRKCVLIAHADPLKQEELELKVLMLSRKYMKTREDKDTLLFYSKPDLPEELPKATRSPSFPPSRIPFTSSPSYRPSSEPFAITTSPSFGSEKQTTNEPSDYHYFHNTSIPARVATFELRMEFPDTKDIDVENTFCTDCFLIIITNNQIVAGLSEIFENGYTHFKAQGRSRRNGSQDSHPILTEADTIYQGLCGSSCLLFNCSVKVINVDPILTKDMFDFELFHAAETFLNERFNIPDPDIKTSFAGPSAVSSDVNINLVGFKSLPKLTEKSKHIFVDTTQTFISTVIKENFIPYKLIDIKFLDQTTKSDVSKGNAPDDIFKNSVPGSVAIEQNKGRLLSIKINFMAFIMSNLPKNKFTTLVQDIIAIKYDDYVASLIASDHAYFKLLDEKVTVKNDIGDKVFWEDNEQGGNVTDTELTDTKTKEETNDSETPDNETPDTETPDTETSGTGSGDSDTHDDKPEGKLLDSPAKRTWSISRISIPISIVTCGLVIIVFHMRSKAQPYVDYDDLIT